MFVVIYVGLELGFRICWSLYIGRNFELVWEIVVVELRILGRNYLSLINFGVFGSVG